MDIYSTVPEQQNAVFEFEVISVTKYLFCFIKVSGGPYDCPCRAMYLLLGYPNNFQTRLKVILTPKALDINLQQRIMAGTKRKHTQGSSNEFYSSKSRTKPTVEARVDPTYGQRCALPGLDANIDGYDEELSYDDQDALSYLKAVRLVHLNPQQNIHAETLLQSNADLRQLGRKLLAYRISSSPLKILRVMAVEIYMRMV